MKIASILLSLLLLISVTACESAEEAKSDEEKEQSIKEEKAQEAKAAVDRYKAKLICPQVAILHQLEDIRDYGHESPVPDQLVSAARMRGLDGDCSYHDDGIDINFIVHFAAGKGPRLGGDRVEFPFFVAVVDPQENVLNKNQMSQVFRFKDDEKVMTKDEPLHVFIPLPKDQQSNGPTYRVLTGFQLSEEQIKEVRGQAKAGN